MCFALSRCLLLPVHPEAAAAVADAAAQHHVPDVCLSARLRRLVLSQRRHLFHRQNRHLHPL
jgi:hypothetical protein